MGEPNPAPPAETVVDPIRGLTLTAEREAEIIKSILLPLGLHESPALFQTKWFDHRRLSPVQATYAFASQYSRAYRRLMTRRIGIEKGQYSLGFSGKDIFENPKLFRPFWKTRQIADQLGTPYDFFVGFAMSWCDQRLWRNLPRPTQLYGDDLIAAVETGWKERLITGTPLPDDSWYKACNYVQHPDQTAFQHWLCDRIEQRPARIEALASALIMTEMLVEPIAIQRFGAETVARANAMWG